MTRYRIAITIGANTMWVWETVDYDNGVVISVHNKDKDNAALHSLDEAAKLVEKIGSDVCTLVPEEGWEQK